MAGKLTIISAVVASALPASKGGFATLEAVELGDDQVGARLVVLTPPGEWTLSAKCAGMGDEFFGAEAEQKMVRRFCGDCPVRQECLKEALDNRIEWGVWGGATERDRRRMLRQDRPRQLIAS